MADRKRWNWKCWPWTWWLVTNYNDEADLRAFKAEEDKTLEEITRKRWGRRISKDLHYSETWFNLEDIWEIAHECDVNVNIQNFGTSENNPKKRAYTFNMAGRQLKIVHFLKRLDERSDELHAERKAKKGKKSEE